MIFAAVSVDKEDDLSPLRAALQKAEKRVQDAMYQRESLEMEAQEVCNIALTAKDRLEQARALVAAAEEEARKREDQLSKTEQQKILAQTELDRLLKSQQSDVLASIDQPRGVDAPAMGDWDVNMGMRSMDSPVELSEEEKAISERKAAIMIIEERAAAFQLELKENQAKLEAYNERCVMAEVAYSKSDAVASAAMKAAEGAVKDELEAQAVAAQVKDALEKAMASLRALEGEGSADEAEAEVPPEPEASVTDQTKQELARIELLDDAEEVEDGQQARKLVPALQKYLPVVALAAGVIAACAFSPLGPWLTQEISFISVAVQKVTALFAAIMDKVPWPQPHHGEEGLWETIALLFTSVIAVPLVMKLIPGGSPVLGFLIGGAVIGPSGLSIVQDIEGVRHLAEMGVVFLLFNIGLELSLDRLQAMAKAVFGLGSLQFVLTTLAIAGVATFFAGYSGPAAIVLGGALALSSTAVAMQVLQDRSESGTRHGRATFAVLLLQDLAVVVLLMLVPLLANGSTGGLLPILQALGVAAVKAVVCIVGIILGGRLILRPVFRRIAALANAEIFAATTLLVVLGSSVLTQIAGLSLALGAFLAGLLMAETEYALQVESDIAPFKGLLMGLFFMSVGMEISLAVLFNNWALIFGSLACMIVGKVAIMALIGQPFGLSKLTAVRAGMYLAPGGEFAFVVLNEAVAAKLLPGSDIPTIFFMVVLSMALTPYLTSLGTLLGKAFETKSVQALQPLESETAELKNHVVIMGFGRVGQTIAQLLSERLIPFVALDVRVERVQAGKAADLPVYFGDAGSPAVLHLVGAERARCAVITLDTPGANYRAVWAMNKHFPEAKIFVRAHDIEHGLNLEKAGATAVVPEILEPSLQLAAAVLGSLNLKQDEISDAIDSFRRSHMSDLRVLTQLSGGSLGYGFDNAASDDDAEVEPGSAEDVIMAKPA